MHCQKNIKINLILFFKNEIVIEQYEIYMLYT